MISFRRTTSSGKFIPEIDGLRFIAIISVVCFHLNGFLREKLSGVSTNDSSLTNRIFELGDLGVPLFFILSGFILALPFGKYFLEEGKKVDLASFYLRRVKRLEPPYILVMVLLAFFAIHIFTIIPKEIGYKSLVSSLFYIHNFVFGREVAPLLNSVAWSLEIEIQFYLLAPFISKFIFRIRPFGIRVLIVIGLILLSISFNYYFDIGFISILDFLNYFLLGYLLVDFYLNNIKLKINPFLSQVIVILLIPLIWFSFSVNKYDFIGYFLGNILFMFSSFFLYYIVIIYKSIPFFANPIITGIGGMCYSIYLLHYPLMSVLGKIQVFLPTTYSYEINYWISFSMLFLIILVVSAVFYILIEKPCMNPNWPSILWTRIKRFSANY